MDASFAGLFATAPGERIAALRAITATPQLDWGMVMPYFERALEPGGDAPEEELALAIEIALQAPVYEFHDRVVRLAHEGEPDERARALMGLARLGDPVEEDILALLTSDEYAGPRDALAEHLLLVDVSTVAGRVEQTLQDEDDPRVRFWLAGALSLTGDDTALKREIEREEVPSALKGLVETHETEGPTYFTADDSGVGAAPPTTEDVTYLVTPRVERIEPAMVASVEAEPPPRSFEVRGGGDDAPPAEAGPRARYFEGRSPGRARLAETIGVELRVALEKAADTTAVPVTLDVPADGLTLTITAHTPGFEIRGGPQLRELHVPAESDSDWLLYQLHALREGVHDVVFTAFNEGRMVAELRVQVSVDALATTDASHEVRAEVTPLTAVEGEVSLTIDWIEERNVYEFQLMDRTLPEEVTTDRLKRTPRQIVESMVAELEAIARGTLHVSDVRAHLRDRGVQLWSELIPQRLQEQFWERQDRIKYLRIFSRDDPIPWELLYPLTGGNDAGFLVEQFPVVRSIRGHAPVAEVGSGRVKTVLPSAKAPTSARDETEMVRSIWQARGADPEIADLAALRSSLEAADFGLLHFACHNVFDPGDANRTTIRLGGDAFTPVVLAPMQATRALAAARPLVFLNACRSAAEAPLYTALSGWASAFMTAGAAAFVGTQWAVRDVAARPFARTFYEKLHSGVNLGNALLAARQAVASDGDPTWLAYTAYGDPSATV